MAEDNHDEVMKLLEKSFTSKAIEQVRTKAAQTDFCPEMGTLAFENVFAKLWGRPGLDHRSRSLLTLGILIALRLEEELKIHAVAAIRNGLSIEELEEVIYHAAGYAGFPSANIARAAAAEALQMEGLVETKDGTYSGAL